MDKYYFATRMNETCALEIDEVIEASSDEDAFEKAKNATFVSDDVVVLKVLGTVRCESDIQTDNQREMSERVLEIFQLISRYREHSEAERKLILDIESFLNEDGEYPKILNGMYRIRL